MCSILSGMTCDIKYEEAERNKLIYVFLFDSANLFS